MHLSHAEISKLQKLCETGKEAQAIFKLLANKERPVKKTDITRVQYELARKGLVIDSKTWASFWKTLEKEGFGAVRLGKVFTHRGKQFTEHDKFMWSYSLIDIGRAALGDVAKTTSEVKSPSKESGERLVTAYPIRPNFMVKISLPADVTKSELRELADFLVTLHSV
jgi:hypothetical protein